MFVRRYGVSRYVTVIWAMAILVPMPQNLLGGGAAGGGYAFALCILEYVSEKADGTPNENSNVGHDQKCQSRVRVVGMWLPHFRGLLLLIFHDGFINIKPLITGKIAVLLSNQAFMQCWSLRTSYCSTDNLYDSHFLNSSYGKRSGILFGLCKARRKGIGSLGGIVLFRSRNICSKIINQTVHQSLVFGSLNFNLVGASIGHLLIFPKRSLRQGFA